jgi:HAD superfamily hydrolase (TIGR01509 family)
MPDDRPILLLDVMSTLVYDPFAVEMPAFFGLTFQEMFARKDPTAWVEFERGEIDEATFFDRFFMGEREVDGEAFRAMLAESYRYLDGVEEMLTALSEAGVPMHTLSNYPSWWEIIESSLELSRWVEWTFVSCRMGVRKPDVAIYARAAATLGVAPGRCLFVDDREKNCEGARAAGMQAVRFESAGQLTDALRARGVL